jgi:hypothetical protein
MAKDAYYFPHDSNAKDDPKSIMLIEELGLEGYGIFWVLIETLRDQPEYKAPMSMLPALGRRYNSSGEKFRAVVSRYGLFEVDNNEFFFSKSFGKRMELIDKKRKELSDAGKLGNIIRWQSRGESGGDGVAIAIKEKEIKVNKIKGEESTDVQRKRFTPPTVDEVFELMNDRNKSEYFVNYYQSNGWKVGKTPMKDWRATVRNWQLKDKEKSQPKTRDTSHLYGDTL